jgi:MtN3 and saliva related transmembrane protein
MQAITVLGFMAGTLTTVSFVPQAHKAWRSKSCDDLSWGMLLFFTVGIFLWLVYGVMLHATPIVVTNSITLVLLLSIILMKTRYRAA